MDVSNYILFGVICIVFFRLPSLSRKRSENLFPFLYALILLSMDLFGFGLRVFQNINGPVNVFFGNLEKPFYNIWIYNIILKMILPLVAIQMIRAYLPPKQRYTLKKIMICLMAFMIVFQILQIEPIYLNQGILSAVGNLCILASCLFYFHTLMTKDEYLDRNILLLPSFWQVTFIMFYTSLAYFNDVSLTYLAENHRSFLISSLQVNRFTGIVQATVFILCLAAPLLKIKMENQPSYA